MQLLWPRIPNFWDHPSPKIKCNQSSKEVGKNGKMEDIFEGMYQRVRDSPMCGINVKNILQRSIHGHVHLKLTCWPWNPMINFKRHATRGRKYSTKWRAFFPSHCTSSSTMAIRHEHTWAPWIVQFDHDHLMECVQHSSWPYVSHGPYALENGISQGCSPLSSSLQWMNLVLLAWHHMHPLKPYRDINVLSFFVAIDILQVLSG